jgi:DHA1 family tetracycline resistance protein-like MFS transporter
MPAGSDEAPPRQHGVATRRAAIAFIFVTVLLDMLSLGMIMPVLPKLVENFMGGNTARAAEIFGVFGTAWALMQFIFSPVLGALSDRYGRRPVVLISNFGLGLDYVLMALAPNLWWLFVGRVISGITAASISTGFAYIADVTPPERRAASFGLMGAAFGLGFILGPALGGVLAAVDPRMPFWVAAALSLLNAMYGLFVLPESLPPERRMSFALRRANPFGALALLRSHAELTGLAIVKFVADLAHAVLPSVFVLYASYRYAWDERAIGITLAVVGACALVVQAGLIGPIVKWLGERRALLLGLSGGVAGFLVFGLASVGWQFWAGIPLLSLWGIAGPTSQSLMTQRVSASEQGQLQGANNSILGIASLIGPGLFTLTFSYFIGTGSIWHLPGAPFLLAAILLTGALTLAWRVTRRR